MKSCTQLVLAAAIGTVAAAATEDCVSQCCLSMAKVPELKGKVYLPDSTAYENRLDSYWSLSAALSPWCMVQPSTAKHVSVIIKTLVAGECPFGIRGGGHGAHKLSNAVDKGVTIDFGNMNSTTWDPDTRLVSIQPGGHWQTVYDELAPYGVAVAGGRAGTVGTGGFVSGGGNSFYSASHGMACDTVANFEVVLADGSIVNANASSNSDLFEALKGTSGNLGLITRFDMYPIEYADPVSSSIIYWAYLPALIGGTILNAAIENTMATVQPPAFDVYYAVDGIYSDTTVVDTLSNVANQLGSGQPPGFRNMWFAASFKNDARPMNYAVEKFEELNAALEEVAPSSETGLNTLCMFQPITKSIAEKGVQNGGNVMGLDAYTEDGNGIMFLLTLALTGTEAHEEAALPLMAAFIDDLDAYSDSLGLKWDWKYLNYAHSSQDVIASFGEEAVAKIKAASAKYDPNGVFQKLRGSGFKIPA
ncbi:FAD binding domain-containing protein [Stachybotrys elegans]|uniref:FAD binding domain-containing protein n=1 Tax=Stachybotrys elegans TaxID=80388 RepID=A0A8K0SSR5_9HYPO|nr:FAD binding domain-containing protein [Stachybotrys elegans]